MSSDKRFNGKMFSDVRCAASRAFARQNPLPADFKSGFIIPYPHRKSKYKIKRKDNKPMRRNKKSCSISEFCRNNNFRTLEFYKMLSRHPEPARKMKANSEGEHVLDEEAMRTAGAILRKEKIKDRRKRSAANEINTLATQIEELRKEVGRLRCENQRLKKVIVSLRTTIRKQDEPFKRCNRSAFLLPETHNTELQSRRHNLRCADG